jgi:hypothetical protein
MDFQTRNEIGETHVDSGTTRAVDAGTTRAHNVDETALYKPSQGILVNCSLRFVAFLLAFISAVVLGAAKETVIPSNSTMRSRVIKSTQFEAYV